MGIRRGSVCIKMMAIGGVERGDAGAEIINIWQMPLQICGLNWL